MYPMDDVVSCGLMGHVLPCSLDDVLLVLLSVYSDRVMFLTVSHEINLVFRLCLQCNPMGDAIPCNSQDVF